MRIKGTVWYRRLWRKFQQELRWLKPGLGVKRWIGLILAGTTLFGVGFAMFLLEIYRTTPNNWLVPVLSTASLRFLDRPLRVVFFGGFGVMLILLGTWGLNHALLRPFMRPGKAILDTMTTFRRKDKGPRIVAIGGGTGLSALLRGLKDYTHNLTAIVTVADDGGSSGELRRSIGVLPPGDIRKCLAALSDDEALLTQLFQYRFAEGAGVNGHTLGNLLITALAEITGSFEEGVAESGRVLAVRGRVLPSTLHDVRLVADVHIPNTIGDVRVQGESHIPKAAGQVRRVWLEPNNPLAYPPALQAILAADIIVIGPGSLYTSILPNLLVPDLADAIRASRAVKFFVCNVATQPGETDSYSCGDHARTVEKHVGDHFFDMLIYNRNYSKQLPANIEWVLPEQDLDQQYVTYSADLIDQDNPWRHDSCKLAQSILDLYFEKTGPLISKEESN